MGDEPTLKVTEYTVSAVPADLCSDAYLWDVKVAWRGKGRWAVLHGPYCLTADGDWDHEMIPSSRTDEWLADHRFSEIEALIWAARMAPLVTINGTTPADLLAKYKPKEQP